MVNFKIGDHELLFVNKYSSPSVIINFYKKCKEGTIEVVSKFGTNGPIPINISEKEICYLSNCLDDFIYEHVYKRKLTLTVDFTTFTYLVKIEIRTQYSKPYEETFSGTLSEFVKTIDYVNLYKKYSYADDMFVEAKYDKAIDKAIESIPNVMDKDIKEAFPLLMPAIMKLLRGTANPAVVKDLLTNRFIK